jgi:predicted SAM-dependent methyltransferase
VNLKSFILNYIHRESLLFKFAMFVSANIQKILNLHNIIQRPYRISQYIKSNKIHKLHFGCGNNIINGFLNTDIFFKIPLDITKKLPFKTETIDFIYSNHVIEHIYNFQFVKYLRETYRILKLNGIHIIATPSLKKICSILYVNKNASQKKKLLHFKGMQMNEKLDSATFLNRQMHINYGHKYLYDYEAIKNIARSIGYRSIIIIDNKKIPDVKIREQLKSRDTFWDMETETYMLKK